MHVGCSGLKNDAWGGSVSEVAGPHEHSLEVPFCPLLVNAGPRRYFTWYSVVVAVVRMYAGGERSLSLSSSGRFRIT